MYNTVQAKLRKNLFNFSVWYLNNTYRILINVEKLKVNSLKCDQRETLKQIIAECPVYLEKYSIGGIS